MCVRVYVMTQPSDLCLPFHVYYPLYNVCSTFHYYFLKEYIVITN